MKQFLLSNKQTLAMAGRIRYLTEVELKKAIDNLIEGLTDEEESIIDSSSHNTTSGKCIIYIISHVLLGYKCIFHLWCCCLFAWDDVCTYL